MSADAIQPLPLEAVERIATRLWGATTNMHERSGRVLLVRAVEADQPSWTGPVDRQRIADEIRREREAR